MTGSAGRCQHPVGRRGFSLLELIVVLVVLACVAAMVCVRWSGLYRKPMVINAVERLEYVDSHMRMYALRHQRSCGLAIDLRNNRIQKRYHSRASQNPRWEPLGRKINIDKLTGATVPDGSIALVKYRPDGSSPSYGVQLSGAGEQEFFLIVAGMSGQVVQYERKADFDHVSELFETE